MQEEAVFTFRTIEEISAITYSTGFMTHYALKCGYIVNVPTVTNTVAILACRTGQIDTICTVIPMWTDAALVIHARNTIFSPYTRKASLITRQAFIKIKVVVLVHFAVQQAEWISGCLGT